MIRTRRRLPFRRPLTVGFHDVLSKIFGWWEGATIGTRFTIAKRGRLVGQDENGNRYYESRDNVSYDGRNEYHYINGGLAETGSCPGDPSASLKLDKHPEKRLKIGARGDYTCTNPDDPENCVPTQDAYSQFRGDIDEVGARSPKSKPLRLP